MFTLIDAGKPVEIDAAIGGDRVRLAPAAMKEALGLELHDNLLCSETMCIPLQQDAPLEDDGAIDLAALAGALDRPLAIDVAERVAFLGVSARERADELASLQAPDFTLPDLDGRSHSLAGQRGKKVLLVAWASW
jgi:hypothetical protein